MFVRDYQKASHFFAAAAFATAMTLALPGHAEDIDLFRINPEAENRTPNVLFLIDNTANWNSTISDGTGGKTSKRTLEHQALATIFQDRPATLDNGDPNPANFENRLNVGFMVFSEEQPEGGVVIKAAQFLDDNYREELRGFFTLEDGDKKAGIPQSNGASYALSMYESYLYFGGRAARAGTPSNGTDKIAPDLRAFAEDNNYFSPGGAACHNYLVVIGNGQPDNGENRGGTPERLLRELGGNTRTISLDPSDFESSVADEYSRFFNNADVVPDNIQEGEQNLATYVIDVFDPDDNQEGNRRTRAGHALLQSIAAQTNPSAYHEVANSDQLLAALQDVLDEILATNTVFAATALPVSVNVRGTNLNQVYIGVFRPDADNRTRWFGNLKLYQLDAADNLGVFLADANDQPAQSASTGFIRNDATSFWTQGSTYWAFDERGEPPSASDAPDGAEVEKGGAAQRLRELETAAAYARERAIYTCTGTCSSGSALSATPFTTANADIPLDPELIDWVRGEDNFFATTSSGGTAAEDEDADGRTDDVRASIHGDVLHSQPAIVNYGADGQEDVVVYYGGNDGMIHAVRGGPDGSTGGTEIWSFVPPEFFPDLDDLRQNTDGKTYFADGNLAAYVKDVNGNQQVEPADGDQVLLYATMRRGGRFIYALDVTDRADPKFLWKVSADTPGFTELGQTFSDVRIGQLQGMADPVAIFGAGYDSVAEDPDGLAGTDNSAAATQGRGLFVVNALDGSLIWQTGPEPDVSGGGVTELVADMTYSMPAGPTAIDRDRDGDLDRIYIPDTGGRVWRINLVDSGNSGGPDPLLWEVHLLADVGADQEFQYPVDVVAAAPTGKYGDRFDAVLVGSGDRENPFETAVVNHFYMFKDAPIDGPGAINPAAPLKEGDLFDATDNRVQDGTDSEQTAAVNDINDSEGWLVTLNGGDTGGLGEKVVGGATTLAGTTFFNTNQPPSENDECGADLGTARAYAVNFRDASSTIEQDGQDGLQKSDRYKKPRGGGFLPSPVPALVEIDGEQYLAVVSGPNVTGVPNIPLKVRERVFFYREGLDD